MGNRKGKGRAMAFDLCRCVLVRVTGDTSMKLHWNGLMAQTFVYQIHVRSTQRHTDGSCMH
jgi:hypothetical protein